MPNVSCYNTIFLALLSRFCLGLSPFYETCLCMLVVGIGLGENVDVECKILEEMIMVCRLNHGLKRLDLMDERS